MILWNEKNIADIQKLLDYILSILQNEEDKDNTEILNKRY